MAVLSRRYSGLKSLYRRREPDKDLNTNQDRGNRGLAWFRIPERAEE